MINTQNDLVDLCTHLQTCAAVAIDTEFTRVQTYWPILSIVQLSDGVDGYIVDFYEKSLDPAPLVAVLTNLHVTKIIHSCRQDFEIFLKEFGVLPQNIFDTQMAATLIYPDEDMGLARLLKHQFDIDLNKAQQNTNWLRRPLSQSQINYALMDVKHLHDLWDVLASKLDKLGRLGWLWEDQQFLLTPETYSVDTNVVWKKIKSNKINPKALGAQSFLHLHRLCQWRELKAQSLNYNRGRVMTDDIILQLVQNPPQTMDALTESYAQMEEKLLIEMWEVFENANRTPRELWPILKKGVPLTGEQSFLLEKLRELQTTLSEKLGISPRVISNNDDLKRFCYGRRDVTFLNGWRHDVFGADALTL